MEKKYIGKNLSILYRIDNGIIKFIMENTVDINSTCLGKGVAMNNVERRFYPLVSVVCPTYNEKDFFKPALESLLNQTYPNIEIVIVDSSTNNEVKKVIKKYENKIHYYWKEKSGIADALNYGIEQAKGEFIARMDADDISVKDRIEKQVTFLIAHRDIMVLGTQAFIINAEGEVIGQSSLSTENSSIKADLIFTGSFLHPSVMFRRQIFDDGIRYDGDFIAEDYDLWTRVALKYNMGNLPEKLIYYRKHNKNASQRLYYEGSMSVSRSAKRYIESLWGLNLENYDIDDTCRYKGQFENTQKISSYIARQIKLMYEIWNANSKKNILDKASLTRALNNRWKWAVSFLGGIENTGRYSSISFNTPIEDSVDEEIFLYKLGRKYNCDIKDVHVEIQKDLETLEADYNNLLSEKKNIVVYGLGQRGVRFLDKLLELKEKKECGWGVTAVSDRKVSGINFCDRFYKSIDISELYRIGADYIVITPLAYEKIEQELLQQGIKKEKIITASILI